MDSNPGKIMVTVEESKSSSQQQQQQPCLLITDRRGSCHIQTNMFNSSKPQLLYDVGGEIPEFLGRRIGCSFGEWMVLTGATGNSLVNLLSKEIIELPPLDIEYHRHFCILTSHPYDPACHIAFFIRDEEGESEWMFCQPGDKEFTIKRWDYDFYPGIVHAVVAGKLFFPYTKSRRYLSLGIIEFKNSTYQFEMVEMYGGHPEKYYYLFESSGELFVVYEFNRCRYVATLIGFEILKADLLNKEWVSVKDLGSVAIFLGYVTAHAQCASVESGIKANSIYFLEDDDLDVVYIYNLKEGSIRLIPAISSVEMRTTMSIKLLNWIMMPCEASFRKLLWGDQESICHDSEKENKTSVEVEEVGVQNSWNTVPPELLNLIQLHLFGRDHAVFRLVCKEWQQVSSIQDHSIPSIPALLSSTTLLELCQSSSSLLMFQEDITISCDSVPIFRFFDPVQQKLYRKEIPELRETDIHYSRDGWLLVSRRSDESNGSIFFFNPLTQEKIELPGMPSDSEFCAGLYSLSFSSLPTSSNCLVVGMHVFEKPMLMYTLKHGEETWMKVKFDEEFEAKYRRKYGHFPVVRNGLHHFICGTRDIAVFNLKLNTGESESESSKFRCDDLQQVFFLEIDGAPALVRVELDGRELSIFKWNDLKKDWELMEEGGVDFGGKEMFLSRRGSFMEKIDDGGGMGNTIFLSMIDHDAKEGLFYSLATHRYHTFYSGYWSELTHNVDKFLNGIWVKPDRKIVGESNLKWFVCPPPLVPTPLEFSSIFRSVISD